MSDDKVVAIKLNIESQTDREKLLGILGNNGFKVWVEKLKGGSIPYKHDQYMLCIEIKGEQ